MLQSEIMSVRIDYLCVDLRLGKAELSTLGPLSLFSADPRQFPLMLAQESLITRNALVFSKNC